VELNYEYLRELQQRETRASQLTKIDPKFYDSLAEYLNSLKIELDEEKIKDLNSPKASLLADELKSATRLVEEIYEKREKKILQMALAEVRGGKPPIKYLTEEEKIFYDEIIKLLKKARRNIFSKKEKSNTVLVRALKSMPKFVGDDMKNYEFDAEDVLTLPKKTAEILIKRKVVEKIEIDLP
jgi:DNA replication initiation complex subunit (GINS family)